ncbi:Kunitz/Bovine pancreatic trypsin inhibitor domain protein [Ancylostoma caninum]|uniref:Kunitz/Bovine pancreatic trypsin inhibitor domain protein n=1 Tax=Ancylostoma caninum TaxID=29170 RepID=A0A368GTT1_ANCCA|nr:Kunitz/Bovine pancreatic trypsin inhibitor domain protein [Ancylostoma caninum]
MKLSVIIICAVIYFCAAAPQDKCLDGEPYPDNSIDGCWPFYWSYKYNKRTGKCESFMDCFYKGRNIFPKLEDCEKACMDK